MNVMARCTRCNKQVEIEDEVGTVQYGIMLRVKPCESCRQEAAEVARRETPQPLPEPVESLKRIMGRISEMLEGEA
jgi:hypothetical protein